MQDNARNGRRNRKRNMSLYYGTVLFLALVIFAVLSLTVFFKVENIVVYGSSVYTAEEIAEVSGIKGGENMIRKSMGRAEKKITSELIYIEEAEIKRKLPSSVEIWVTPCAETACMENEDGFLIVSGRGKVLRAAESPPENMPVFYGANPIPETEIGGSFVSDDENRTEVIYELLQQLQENSFAAGITSYNVADRVNISCIYEDRIEIELGVVSDLEYKFSIAEEIISADLSPDSEGRLYMLKNGARFLSKADLEQIEENRRHSTETTVTDTETEVPDSGNTASEATNESTKLNFE